MLPFFVVLAMLALSATNQGYAQSLDEQQITQQNIGFPDAGSIRTSLSSSSSSGSDGASLGDGRSRRPQGYLAQENIGFPSDGIDLTTGVDGGISSNAGQFISPTTGGRVGSTGNIGSGRTESSYDSLSGSSYGSSSTGRRITSSGGGERYGLTDGIGTGYDSAPREQPVVGGQRIASSSSGGRLGSVENIGYTAGTSYDSVSRDQPVIGGSSTRLSAGRVSATTGYGSDGRISQENIGFPSDVADRTDLTIGLGGGTGRRTSLLRPQTGSVNIGDSSISASSGSYPASTSGRSSLVSGGFSVSSGSVGRQSGISGTIDQSGVGRGRQEYASQQNIGFPTDLTPIDSISGGRRPAGSTASRRPQSERTGNVEYQSESSRRGGGYSPGYSSDSNTVQSGSTSRGRRPETDNYISDQDTGYSDSSRDSPSSSSLGGRRVSGVSSKRLPGETRISSGVMTVSGIRKPASLASGRGLLEYVPQRGTVGRIDSTGSSVSVTGGYEMYRPIAGGSAGGSARLVSGGGSSSSRLSTAGTLIQSPQDYVAQQNIGIPGGRTGVRAPIRLPVITRHSIEYVDVPTSRQVEPLNIQVAPTRQAVDLSFNSRTSPIIATQSHEPSGGSVQVSRTEDEPIRLSHTVTRPVIQEVREVIAPLRRVTQEIRPVQEEIRTIVHVRGDRPITGGRNSYRPAKILAGGSSGIVSGGGGSISSSDSYRSGSLGSGTGGSISSSDSYRSGSLGSGISGSISSSDSYRSDSLGSGIGGSIGPINQNAISTSGGQGISYNRAAGRISGSGSGSGIVTGTSGSRPIISGQGDSYSTDRLSSVSRPTYGGQSASSYGGGSRRFYDGSYGNSCKGRNCKAAASAAAAA